MYTYIYLTDKILKFSRQVDTAVKVDPLDEICCILQTMSLMWHSPTANHLFQSIPKRLLCPSLFIIGTLLYHKEKATEKLKKEGSEWTAFVTADWSTLREPCAKVVPGMVHH